MKKYNINGLETWQKIGIICLLIVVPGFIGWIFEFICAWYNHGMNSIFWKGGNFLPWINMYSIGGFLILASTYKFRDKPLKVFLASVLIAGVFELITGYVLYKYLGHRYWNYENEILNFYGFICIKSILCFGIAGLILTYIIVPWAIRLSKRLPKKTFLIICISLCVIVLIDEFYNFFISNLFNLPGARKIYLENTFFK